MPETPVSTDPILPVPLQRIAGILLGLPGADPLDTTSTDWRLQLGKIPDTAPDPASQAEIDHAIDTIMSMDTHQISLSEQIHSKGQIDRIKQSITSPELYNIFNKRFISNLLQKMIEFTQEFPSYDSIAETVRPPYQKPGLSQAQDSCRKILHILFLLELFHTDQLTEVINRNVTHDIANLFKDLSVILGVLQDMVRIAQATEGEISEIHSVFLDKVKTAFLNIAFAQAILRANLKLIHQKADIAQPFNFKDICSLPLAVLQERFGQSGYRMTTAEEDSTTEAEILKPGNVTVICTGISTLKADPDLLLDVIFNTTKNPLKIALLDNAKTVPERRNPLIAVVISLEQLGEKCASIFIRDTGATLSHDLLRKKYTKRAEEKRSAEEPLTLLEHLLLSEQWRDKVSSYLLNKELFTRGESVANGTGIGLDLVQKIVQAHQGYLRIYDHPKYGVGVQIVLPNTDSTDPVERSRIVQQTVIADLIAALPAGIANDSAPLDIAA